MPLNFLPFLLLIVPIMEITVFVLVGGQIGVLSTIALILLTAVLGSILLRIEGLKTYSLLQQQLAAGQMPGNTLAKGAMILVAGVLLLTPGFITDTIGFALFVPQVRSFLWSLLSKRFVSVKSDPFAKDGSGSFYYHSEFHNSQTEDPGVVELDPEEFQEKKPRSNSPWYGDKERID